MRSGYIVGRAVASDFPQTLRKSPDVKRIIEAVIFQHPSVPDFGHLSYEQLGIPPNLLLLILAIVRRLPAHERIPWLNDCFRSMQLNVDLEAMNVWRWFLHHILQHSLPTGPNNPEQPGIENSLREAAMAVGMVLALLKGGEPNLDNDAWEETFDHIGIARRSLILQFEAKEASGEVSARALRIPTRIRRTLKSLELAEHIMEMAPLSAAGRGNLLIAEELVDAATVAVPMKTQGHTLLGLFIEANH